MYKDILSHLIDHLLAIIPSLPEDKYLSFSSLACRAPEASVVGLTTPLPSQRLELLLRETFPYVLFDELQALPFAIMQHCPEIPRAFLRRLAASPKLYQVRSHQRRSHSRTHRGGSVLTRFVPRRRNARSRSRERSGRRTNSSSARRSRHTWRRTSRPSCRRRGPRCRRPTPQTPIPTPHLVNGMHEIMYKSRERENASLIDSFERLRHWIAWRIQPREEPTTPSNGRARWSFGVAVQLLAQVLSLEPGHARWRCCLERLLYLAVCLALCHCHAFPLPLSLL